MSFRPWLLLLAIVMQHGVAAVPTDFVVAPDNTAFSPTEPLHAGDRLFVQSPYLYEDDLAALGRCIDVACANLDIVRVWTAHRRNHLRDYVNILRDGKYVFFVNTVPRNLPGQERRGCFRSAPLYKVCSGSQRLAITEQKSSPEVFRARFSTDSWLWVRKVRSTS